ncbi:arginyl-tRNA synthetase [Elusimicrobium posterum]
MLDKLRREIEVKIFNSAYFAGHQLPYIELTPAPEHTGADISLNWAMVCAKIMRKSPLEIAKAAAKVIPEVNGVHSADYVAPGFINIKLEDAFIIETSLDRRYKDRHAGENRGRILIEFVSANPTGPLHVASGRGASLGDSLVKIFNAVGYPCDAEYYVNDSGNQAELLGKSLKARVEGKEPPENGYMGTYLIDMAEEIKDKSKGWTEKEYSDYAIEYLIKSQKEDMKVFNVEFTRWFRESELYKEDAPDRALQFLKNKDLAYEKDGATWLGTKADDADDKDRVLVRTDGRPTYFLADIAYHKNKYDRGYTKLIDILGADHHGYVPRMRYAIKALGHSESSFVPIIHQLVHLIEGGEKVKMSKRSGKFITLRGLVDEVGADACRFMFASRTPDAHMNFDLDMAKKRSNENPVFYVQYVHARIFSIAKSAEEKHLPMANYIEENALAPQERAILMKLMWFRTVLTNCVKDLSPTT